MQHPEAALRLLLHRPHEDVIGVHMGRRRQAVHHCLRHIRRLQRLHRLVLLAGVLAEAVHCRKLGLHQAWRYGGHPQTHLPAPCLRRPTDFQSEGDMSVQ